MTRKIPSSANLFKQLIKEDLEESNSELNREDMPRDVENKPTEIDASINNSKIDDVVKVMEQAAFVEINDSENLSGSLPEVTQTHTAANKTHLNVNNEELIRKKKPVRLSEDKREAAGTPIEPTFVKKTTAAPLKKRSIYLTSEQFMQIRIRAVQEDCDGSQIVRNAIDAFFKNDSK